MKFSKSQKFIFRIVFHRMSQLFKYIFIVENYTGQDVEDHVVPPSCTTGPWRLDWLTNPTTTNLQTIIP